MDDTAKLSQNRKKKKPFVVREIPSETLLDPRLRNGAHQLLGLLWSKADVKTGELRIGHHWFEQHELVRMARRLGISESTFRRVMRKQLIPLGYVTERERELKDHTDRTGRRRKVFGPQYYVVFKSAQQPHKQRAFATPKSQKPRCVRVSTSGQNWPLEENARPLDDSSSKQHCTVAENSSTSGQSTNVVERPDNTFSNPPSGVSLVVSGFDFDFGSDFDVPVNGSTTQGESGFQKAPRAKLPRWQELEALGLSKTGSSRFNPGTMGDRYAKLIRDHEAEPGQQPDEFHPLPNGVYLRIEARLLALGTRFDSDPLVLRLVGKLNQHKETLFVTPYIEAEAEKKAAAKAEANAKEAEERERKRKSYYASFAIPNGWSAKEFSAEYEAHKHLDDEELFARFYKKWLRQTDNTRAAMVSNKPN